MYNFYYEIAKLRGYSQYILGPGRPTRWKYIHLSSKIYSIFNLATTTSIPALTYIKKERNIQIDASSIVSVKKVLFIRLGYSILNMALFS